MTDIRRVFEVGDRVRLEASTTSGDIVVSEGDSGVVDVLVDSGGENYDLEQHGDLITVRPKRGLLRRFSSSDIHLEVPPQASLSLSCTSGDIIVNAPVRELHAGTAAGDLRIGFVERSANLRSASGDVYADEVGERLQITTASGTVRIGTVGRDLTVTSASGDVQADYVGESANVKSASGDVRLRNFEGGDLRARTLSGDISIGLPPRRLLDVDLQTLSGELRNRLPEGDGSEPDRTVTLHLKTVSGDVTLRGA